MTYTVVGLFQNQEKAGKVSKELESAGIRNSDYIVYKTNNEIKREKATIWERVFNINKPEVPNPEKDKLITSVEIHNEKEMNAVKTVFNHNNVVHTYEFQDMTIDEAKDLNYIKKIVEIRAKSQIFQTPTSKGFSSNQGINSEVKA